MKWYSSATFYSPVPFGLCLTEKGFNKELKKIGLPRNTWPDYTCSDASASTYTFDCDEGQRIIVTVGDMDGLSQLQVYAILVHEAVHIWQAICNAIGEEAPSPEFEAYSIQSISLNLMEDYTKRVKSKETTE